MVLCRLQNQNHHWDGGGGGGGGGCLRGHWRHLPLHSVDAGPRGNEGQDAGDEVYQHAGWVTLVAPRLPQLVQTCSQNENYSCLTVVMPTLYTHNYNQCCSNVGDKMTVINTIIKGIIMTYFQLISNSHLQPPLHTHTTKANAAVMLVTDYDDKYQ